MAMSSISESYMHTRKRRGFEVISVFRNAAVACGMIYTLGACQSLGPSAVRVGMPEYNLAINETSDQVMLLNFVRIRYSESPYQSGSPVLQHLSRSR